MKKFLELFKKKSDNKPELTHEKMELLLKKTYNDIVVYNIDTGAMNQKIYNGQLVVGLRDIASKMPEFKQKWEQSSALQDLQPVSIVARTVHHRFDKYDRYGSDVAGNVIVWDKKKKDYYALSSDWFYVCGHMCNVAASEQCLYDVANYVCTNIRGLERLARERRR